MARLIDADILRDEWLYNSVNEKAYEPNDFLNSIDEQPTVDVVQVVRCKDCKKYVRAFGGSCSWHNSLVKP